jgi:hypothetical protein
MKPAGRGVAHQRQGCYLLLKRKPIVALSGHSMSPEQAVRLPTDGAVPGVPPVLYE